jgi:hypothetical protein
MRSGDTNNTSNREEVINMGKGQSGRPKIVPESHQAIDLMKYEIAAEMGLPVGANRKQDLNSEFASELGQVPSSNQREDYWGYISSRDTGAVGGTITARLIQKAEQTLLSL